MTEQHKYYTLTEDVKTLIQYVQEQVFDHSVVEAANRLNLAIKKGLRDYGIPVTPIKESKDSFEEEKLQYAEDRKTHERPWELWQYISSDQSSLEWRTLEKSPKWSKHCVYRRKPTTVVPEYYSGLNWRDAEHLIGKTVECTNNPDAGWKVCKLQIATRPGECFNVDIGPRQYFYDCYTYIRTCEETFKHPTINICGVELPKPETVAPSHGTKYWTFPGGICQIWNGFTREIDALHRGQVHLTEERAKAWTDWWKKEVIAKIKEIAS